ncbi:MAG: YceI family protein [Bacteroidia bacterium]|nr:YceI family protein [Bacteroidia bacterium]
MKKVIIVILLMILAEGLMVSKGQTFELSKTGTEVLIKGTSSLHDWEMGLKVINCGVRLNQEGSLLKNIDNVTFSCKATDIKSEYTLMNKRTYEALKADAFPEIKFSWISTMGLITENKKFKGSLQGRLIVAGVTRDVIISFSGIFIDSNTINITASTDLNMSSFNIIPPTFMMGALKTGDKISVSFSLQFVQNNVKVSNG